MARLPYRPHGAARIAAGLGPVASLHPELPDEVCEQALRAELDEHDLHVAWEIGRLPAGLAPEERVAISALVLLSQDALAQGSTRIALDAREIEARARSMAMSAPLRSAIANIIARREEEPLRQLFGVPGDARPLIVEGGYLYHQRLHELEVRLAAALRARLAVAWPHAVGEIRHPPSFSPTPEQEEAIRSALAATVSVISGGPGTGKTSIVVSLLLTVLAEGELGPSSIALAAPTGKAADRLREAIDRALPPMPALGAPLTLHRLLGYSPHHGTFRHHAGSPLAERLIVVDECSMIDVYLMERLVQSLRADARLVLLGDAEQLPSVAAGAVFRDLAQAARVPTVRLLRSHRMREDEPAGANILRVAAAINEGRMPPQDRRSQYELPGRDSDAITRIDALAPDAPLGGVLHVASGLDGFLDAWLARFVEPGRALAGERYQLEGALLAPADAERAAPLFDLAERARILGITRSASRATGVEALSAALHRRYAAAADARWVAGEPVLVHRNDYERGLFNGDQGLLLWTMAPSGPRLSAVFRRDNRFLAHPFELVRSSLSLGFATTVHKAQGSEHDVVALVLPDTDVPRLMTREIVYTAITRARRAVLLVGDLELVQRAAARRVLRSTGIGERLA